MSDQGNIEHSLGLNQFEKLFRDHFPQLCAYALRFTGDIDSAKEIVHNVFVNVWESRNRIQANKNLRSYLYASVYNRCLNYIRDTKKTESLDDAVLEVSTVENPATIETEELQATIDAAIQSLPERCRQIFRLSRFDELKYSEIAVKLNISVKTVEVQMSKALKLLRRDLSEFLSIIIIFFLK